MFLTYLCALLINIKHPECEYRSLIVPPLEQSLQNFGLNNPEEMDPTNMKVVVWNIYKSEKPNWSKDFITFGHENDVLLIQEAFLNKTFLTSTQELSEHYYTHATSFIFKGENIPTGTLTASKYNIASSRIIRSTDGEPIINTPKTISVDYHSLKDTDLQLLTLNIHGLNATRTADFSAQVNSTLKIINEHQGPILFAGDFNTRNKSRTKFMNKFFKDLKFKEVKWPNDKRKKVFGFFIDHAFVRDLTVLSSKVRDDINTSDHKALELVLKYDQN